MVTAAPDKTDLKNVPDVTDVMADPVQAKGDLKGGVCECECDGA